MIEKLAVRIILAVVALLLAAALGGWAGFKVSESRHLDKITSQSAQITKLEAAKALNDDLAARESTYCKALDKAVAEQDARIAELGAQMAAHKAAAADARVESARLQREAAALLAKRPPAGADVCVAARAAFDNELRAERTE